MSSNSISINTLPNQEISPSTPNLKTVSSQSRLDGFFPVMKKMIDYQTSNKWMSYYWQIEHPIRRRALEEKKNMRIDKTFDLCWGKNVCTITAYNIFSLFVENSLKADDDYFNKYMNCYEKKGLIDFERLIAKSKSFQGQKGIAFCCSVGKGWDDRKHDFVLELTPSRKFRIYQSYFKQYSLDQCFRDQDCYEIDQLVSKLDLIASETIFKKTPEREEAYKSLFHAKGDFTKLDFFFIPVEYEMNSIPEAPITLMERIQPLFKVAFQSLLNVKVVSPFYKKLSSIRF